MSRKLFYMIRHGESKLNALNIRQGSEGGLSDKGRAQVEATARRFSNSRFDVMLVSPYERTKETAEIIASYVRTRKPMELNDLLKERRNPSEIIGRKADEREVAHIIDKVDKSYHDDDYRYSDEENFSDLRNRAAKLLEYLEKRQEKKLIVVTHGIFLKMIAAHVIYREQLNAEKYNLLSFFNTSDNASVTVFEYDSGFLGNGWIGDFFFPKGERWKLIAWDDVTR